MLAITVPEGAREVVWLLPHYQRFGGLPKPRLTRQVYRPDAAGVVWVRPEHVPEFMRQGATLVPRDLINAIRGDEGDD